MTDRSPSFQEGADTVEVLVLEHAKSLSHQMILAGRFPLRSDIKRALGELGTALGEYIAAVAQNGARRFGGGLKKSTQSFVDGFMSVAEADPTPLFLGVFGQIYWRERFNQDYNPDIDPLDLAGEWSEKGARAALDNLIGAVRTAALAVSQDSSGIAPPSSEEFESVVRSVLSTALESLSHGTQYDALLEEEYPAHRAMSVGFKTFVAKLRREHAVRSFSQTCGMQPEDEERAGTLDLSYDALVTTAIGSLREAADTDRRFASVSEACTSGIVPVDVGAAGFAAARTSFMDVATLMVPPLALATLRRNGYDPLNGADFGPSELPLPDAGVVQPHAILVHAVVEWILNGPFKVPPDVLPADGSAERDAFDEGFARFLVFFGDGIKIWGLRGDAEISVALTTDEARAFAESHGGAAAVEEFGALRGAIVDSFMSWLNADDDTWASLLEVDRRRERRLALGEGNIGGD